MKYNLKTCLVYLDDLIIFWNTLDDHVKHFAKMLTTLAAAELKPNINKCHFFLRQVPYFGQIVKPGSLENDKTNVASVHNG